MAFCSAAPKFSQQGDDMLLKIRNGLVICSFKAGSRRRDDFISRTKENAGKNKSEE
jgi:hypothetical protein